MSTDPLVIPGSRKLKRRPIWANKKHVFGPIRWESLTHVAVWSAKTRPIVYRIPRSKTCGDAYYAIDWTDAQAAGVVDTITHWMPYASELLVGQFVEDENHIIGQVVAYTGGGGLPLTVEWPLTTYAEHKARAGGAGRNSLRLVGPLTVIARATGG